MIRILRQSTQLAKELGVVLEKGGEQIGFSMVAL
jgi:hypothetical protein